MSPSTPKKKVRFASNGGSGDGSYSSDGGDGDDFDIDISSSRRRGQINIDGYGSDASDQDEVGERSDSSEDEDEPDRLNGEQGTNKTGKIDEIDMADDYNDADVDMFSDSVSDPSTSNPKSRLKKRKKFLDLNDIEGQEMSSISRIEDRNELLITTTPSNETSSSKGKMPDHSPPSPVDHSDAEGYLDVSQRGPRIDAFNMKADLEEGRFDESGNFVWNKKDPDEYRDGWLEGVSKDSIKRARISKEQLEKRQEKHEKDIHKKWDEVSKDDIYAAIVNWLKPRETIPSALSRIGGGKRKTKKRWGKKAKSASKTMLSSEDEEKEKERQHGIETLTELADQAMGRGAVNVYEQTYEQFVRQLRMSDRILEDWVPGSKLPTPADPDLIQPISDESTNKFGDVGLLDDIDDLGQSHTYSR